MEVSEVRRRLRAAIDQARRDSSQRRERADAANREFDQFLAQIAVPTFQTIANVLVAEGHRFTVNTPAGSVRLASERSGEDFIELALDSAQDPPAVVVRTSRGRGRRQLSAERLVSTPIVSLTDADVVQIVVDEIPPFVER
jgi:hypothetical protein